MMETLTQELTAGLPDAATFARLTLRLGLAAVLGAIVGSDRERMGKPAGLRTHMLVCMGAALFVIAPSQSGMAIADVSRVIQGLAAGVGFLGGGAILKLSAEREILGITTAATIWMTAALGVAIGLGRTGLALVAVTFTWITLSLVGLVERRRDDVSFAAQRRSRAKPPASEGPVGLPAPEHSGGRTSNLE
jgi:putative Mg2+ transporter-C (MgtC) family protein